MDLRESRKIKRISLILLFYASFFVIGLLLWYWFGMGWFMLMYTLRRFFLSFYPLHIPIVRILMGSKYDKEAEIRYRLKGNHLFVSRSSVILLVVSIIITIFIFWKYNISLHQIIENIIN